MNNKYCPSCQQYKDLDEFPLDSSRKSGRRPYCRECYKSYQDKYYADHRDKLLPEHRVTATRSYYKRRIKALLEVE